MMPPTNPSLPHIGIVANSVQAVYNFRLGLIRRLQAEGFRVTVVAPIDTFAYLLLREGVHLENLPHSIYTQNPLSDLGATWRLYRLYCRLRPDFLLHYTIKPNTFGALAAWLAGIPAVAIVTGTGMLFTEKSPLKRIIMQGLYRWTTPLTREVWFLNESDREVFLRRRLVNPAHTRLIPGEGVDTDWYAPQPSKADPSGEIVFLFAGRLIVDKGIREFVAAARQVRRRFPQAVFQVLGYLERHRPSAIPASEIENWVAEGSIEYLGGATDVRPYIANADVVVLPSYYSEGMNRLLQEAASMCKPLITTDMPGCRELVLPERSGLLIPPRDVVALARAMEQLLHRSSTDLVIMGQLGRAHIQRHYRQELIHAVYVEVLAKYGVGGQCREVFKVEEEVHVNKRESER